MSQRITNADLNSLVKRINEAKGITDPKWNTIGSYQIDGAYGGVKLVKVTNEGGGQTDISRDGYGTKKQLYTFLCGFVEAM